MISKDYYPYVIMDSDSSSLIHEDIGKELQSLSIQIEFQIHFLRST